MSSYNFISFLGIFILLGVAWLFSAQRKVFNWPLVLWGIGLQIFLAGFIFVFPAGQQIFIFLNDIVVKVLDCAGAGSKFLFGRLAIGPGQINEAGEQSLGFILAFQAFPTIIFFSALVSLLYFFRIMPLLIRVCANLFTRLMKVSGAEALCTATNIFTGVESFLTVKPYLNKMTTSEICVVLTAGMATVSSNILAVYVFSLQA